jgi:hypothetical protein
VLFVCDLKYILIYSTEYIKNPRYKALQKSFFVRQSNNRNLTFVGPCIVIYFYSKFKEMHQFFKFILFCSSSLHVSDGLWVHRQDSKTVHTALGVCQTDSADCLLAGNQQNLFDIHLMLYVQSSTPDDRRKDRPKHVD